MSEYLKRNNYLREFQSLHQNKIRFQTPLILRMYGALNKVNMRRENRYILCNFLDQHSEQIDLDDNVYETNSQKSLNQLFLLAINKAKEFKLLEALYNEYLNSINAINSKIII
ncbi:MAG: hypothetical protein KAX18_10525 [Candidatus Lokiarchaeota archaeon]|nr:hypothetical protein [Candidatus Lokiarchaeota archaeon]